MNDSTEPLGASRAELTASAAALPGQQQAASHPALCAAMDDDGMGRFNPEHVGLLEGANAALVRESLRIDPAHLDLQPCIRFWSHVCISHGDLNAEAFACDIPARTIVVALHEAQARSEAAPGMAEIAAQSPELAERLRAAVTHPDMTLIWRPEELEGRACDFRLGDLASDVEGWDMEAVQDLFGPLMEMVDLCDIAGTTLADHIDIDDLPSVELPAGCTGEAIWALDRGGQVIAGTALARGEARVMALEACHWTFPTPH